MSSNFRWTTSTIKKTITSSDITTAAQNMALCVGWDVLIENVIVATDSTGLAGGTNFVLAETSTKGSGTFFAETVANLWASATVDLANASVTNVQQPLQDGKYITFNNTVAVGTGAGTVDIYITYRTLDEGGRVDPM